MGRLFLSHLCLLLLGAPLSSFVGGQPPVMQAPPGSIPTPTCPANANATAALQAISTPTQIVTLLGPALATLNVTNVPGVGYVFEAFNVSANPIEGGPNLTRGSIFLPEDGVDPAAYAPYARNLAELGYVAIITSKRSIDAVVNAMDLYPSLQYWALGGHGQGGTLAATLANLFMPRVKGLALFAAALPAGVDFSGANIFVTHAYGSSDTVVPPDTVLSDAARLPPDAWLVPFDLGHYDFAYAQCQGNALNSSDGSGLSDGDAASIQDLFEYPILLAQWAEATPRALSYSDTSLLTPGLNVSKIYPVNSTGVVTFQTVAIPNTVPQRNWFVFSPPAGNVSGGYIYYPGAAVDSRAYFPLAFEIAARGWLVVVIQQTARLSSLFSQDATAVITSNNAAFSQVPTNRWAIGGHSAGGVSAAAFALTNASNVIALVMHSGALSGNLSATGLPFVNIVGNIDGLAALAGSAANEFGPVPTITIVGANHYQIGDYGYQAPDNVAVISQDDQQSQFAQATVDFLNAISPSGAAKRRFVKYHLR